MSTFIQVTEEKNPQETHRTPVVKLYGKGYVNSVISKNSKATIALRGKKNIEERVVSETYAAINSLLNTPNTDYVISVTVKNVTGNIKTIDPYSLSIRASLIVEAYADPHNSSDSIIRVKGEENKEDVFYTVDETLSNILSLVPKKYKALLSQNAPVATTTNPTMVAGQIWTLEAYNVADAATIAALELISGTLYAIGSKYRSATDQTLAVNVATTLSYDGSPYVVSTDVNGDLNPFVNTLGEMPTLAYDSAGYVNIDKIGNFDLSKTFPKVGTSYNQTKNDAEFRTYVYTDNKIWIDSFSGGVNSDNVLYYTPFEIEIYP